MAKFVQFACVIVIAQCQIGNAQGLLRGKSRGNRPNGLLRQINEDSDDKRQDVEGTIWEYKVLDPKEKDPKKQTLMTGRLRIKQTSIFAIGQAKIKNGAGKLAEEPPKAPKKEQQGSDVRGQLQGLLSQRINKSKEQSSGGERIGDIAKASSNKYRYEFDQDDDYPLSRLVDVSADPDKKNGVLSGNYEEFSGGKKVNRWRFEMR